MATWLGEEEEERMAERKNATIKGVNVKSS